MRGCTTRHHALSYARLLRRDVTHSRSRYVSHGEAGSDTTIEGAVLVTSVRLFLMALNTGEVVVANDVSSRVAVVLVSVPPARACRRAP